MSTNDSKVNGWFRLEPRDATEDNVTGEIYLEMQYQKTDKKHYGPPDFQVLKLIGKGLLQTDGQTTLFLTILFRHLRSGISSQKERHTKNLRDEGAVEEGYCAKERGRSHTGGEKYPRPNSHGRLAFYRWIEVFFPN